MTPAHLCIADPPYLGRGFLYKPGASGTTPFHSGTGSYFNEGRTPTTLATTEHPDAEEWDNPQRHTQLVHDLTRDYDGYVIAAARDSIPTYLTADPTLRIAVWARPNAVPGGSHILGSWEPVLVHVPEGRRRQVGRGQVRDVLTASAPRAGHIGAKPPAWTRWCLDMLWYQPGDTVTDLFPGSGAVAAEIAQQTLDLP